MMIFYAIKYHTSDIVCKKSVSFMLIKHVSFDIYAVKFRHEKTSLSWFFSGSAVYSNEV
jgi:hypothetical protein